MTISSSERGRVLIVDDDRKILDLLGDLLELEGYEISTAADGAEAIDLMGTFEPDIVVSDVVMPNVGGLELCRRLKADTRTAYVPVLLISGLITSDDAGIEGLHAGADDYLDLPFRNEELLVKVARLVERHRLQKHYSELFENANDIIYTHDLQGNFTSLNRSGERITGYSREEAAAMNVADVIAPEYLELVRQMMAQKAVNKAPTVYELDIISKQGRCVRLEVSTRLIFRDGQPVGVQGIGRDLTERKHPEGALLNRLTMAIRASLSLPEVLSTATVELGRALAASRVHLFLHNSEEVGSPLEHEYLADGIRSIKNLGIDYDDAIGRRLSSSLQPLIIDDALNYEDASTALSDYLRAEAQRLDIRSQINYPLVVKGQFRGVLCIHQTDRKRLWVEDEVSLVEALAERLSITIAQAELFEMVARGKTEWETTFDAMSDGIFIFDRTGELKRVNRAGAAMEAVHPRLLLGRQCCDILRTSEEDEACVVEKALETGRSVTIEITPSRLKRPLLVTVEPVLDESNKAIAVVCTARDLSELRKVQAVAREHQSLLTNILESARESIYAVDPDGNFKWCNTATLKGLGYQRSNFIGRPLLSMVYEPDRKLVKEKLALALTGSPQTYEMRYFAHDGQLRYARVDNSPLVVEGKTTGVLGIARDITEQKEERERAARADKLRALGQLASGVAHDFNNSLAAILGRAQLLRRQVHDPALIRNLDIIQTAAEDAAATVRRIQTFARKSSATEFELVDVAGLLNDAVEITRTRWQNEARFRGLEYEVTLDTEAGHHTYGSASELREVFVNLIVNAVDAMPKGGRLLISCHRKDDRLQLHFTDNGMGMPDDVRQKIFEPFFSTKGAHGTGLGLSVSYSIVERHSGSIRVISEPGNGATFTIDLPAAMMENPSDDRTRTNTDAASLRILVVDDEEPVRGTLAEMLVAVNHKVELAGSGQEAVQKMQTGDFDFVFTDLAMPEMDGWETARLIRKDWPDVRIVLVTGYGPTTAPPEGEEDLVDAVIGKPFDFAQVGATLDALMRITELQAPVP